MTKILLVEDDKNLREIYGVRLLAEGYDIVSAGDGEEALAMAIKERPSLIVSDVMMPKISGFDMLDILQSTTETKDIKVIMMTALSGEDQRQRGEQLGAARYLVKSQVGIEDVVRAVHEVLGDQPQSTQPDDIDDNSNQYSQEEDRISENNTYSDNTDNSNDTQNLSYEETKPSRETSSSSNENLVDTNNSIDQTSGNLPEYREPVSQQQIQPQDQAQQFPQQDPRLEFAPEQGHPVIPPEDLMRTPAQQPNHQKTERATVPIQPTGVYSTLDERPPQFSQPHHPVQQTVQPVQMPNLENRHQSATQPVQSNPQTQVLENAQAFKQPQQNIAQQQMQPEYNYTSLQNPQLQEQSQAYQTQQNIQQPAMSQIPQSQTQQKTGGERVIQPLNGDVREEINNVADRLAQEINDIPPIQQ
jgi:PAS/PAC sensor hybrid histidine kinase